VVKTTAIAILLLALASAASAGETVIYPQLPRDRQCAAIVDEGGGKIAVLIRCKGYIDWVVYTGKR
jgi:hypothetical protein